MLYLTLMTVVSEAGAALFRYRWAVACDIFGSHLIAKKEVTTTGATAIFIVLKVLSNLAACIRKWGGS